MKLISMMDYIDYIQDNGKIDVLKSKAMLNLIKYKNFLRQPLELWMFVPCVDGIVLEYLEKNTGNTETEFNAYTNIYESSKEKCLFSGFIGKTEDDILCEFGYLNDSKKTIEYLIDYDLQLTETAIKQLGL
jgi:hypothetical protein